MNLGVRFPIGEPHPPIHRLESRPQKPVDQPIDQFSMIRRKGGPAGRREGDIHIVSIEIDRDDILGGRADLPNLHRRPHLAVNDFGQRDATHGQPWARNHPGQQVEAPSVARAGAGTSFGRDQPLLDAHDVGPDLEMSGHGGSVTFGRQGDRGRGDLHLGDPSNPSVPKG
ncbi:MAG TPA: hypothetical protein VID04_08855 [Methylomirabilota bacterium]